MRTEGRRGRAVSPKPPTAIRTARWANAPYHVRIGGPVCRRLAEGGFTLVEMLVVIVIIALLAGLVVGAAKVMHTKAATSRAQTEIAMIENVLEQYKNDNGVYPPSTANRATASGYPGTFEIQNSGSLFTALVQGPKSYISFKPEQIGTNRTLKIGYIVDPFGSPYNYFNPPAGVSATRSNQATYDLWSYGPDDKNDTADDITNWRQ